MQRHSAFARHATMRTQTWVVEITGVAHVCIWVVSPDDDPAYSITQVCAACLADGWSGDIDVPCLAARAGEAGHPTRASKEQCAFWRAFLSPEHEYARIALQSGLASEVSVCYVLVRVLPDSWRPPAAMRPCCADTRSN